MFSSILTDVAGSLTIQNALICTGTSLVLGIIISLVFTYKSCSNKNFAITLALLPTIVQAIIMLVNGNLGTGIAIMGAFTLVRFRSQPGNSKEILSIMFAMSIGLATGMGYITFAAIFAVILCVVWFILTLTPFATQKTERKELKITIPENLDYSGVFDDEFKEFASSHSLERVRTTNMGSLYELRYFVTLKNSAQEKQFIDALRCKNGNLPIVFGRIPENTSVL